MKNAKTRLGRMAICFILSLCMVVTMMPAMVFATEEIPHAGTQGNPIPMNAYADLDRGCQAVNLDGSEKYIYYSLTPRTDDVVTSIEAQIATARIYTDEKGEECTRPLDKGDYEIQLYSSGDCSSESIIPKNKNKHYDLEKDATYYVKFSYYGEEANNVYVYWNNAIGTSNNPIFVWLNEWSMEYKVSSGDAVYYQTDLSEAEDASNIAVICKDNQGNILTSGDAYNCVATDKGDDCYSYKIEYKGEEPTRLRLMLSTGNVVQNTIPDVVKNTEAYRSFSASMDAAREQLSDISGNPARARIFSIADPIELGAMRKEASKNILYYLGELYRTDEDFDYVDYQRRILNDPNSSQNSWSYNPNAEYDYAFVMDAYSVLRDKINDAYLLYSDEGLLYWSSEPDIFAQTPDLENQDVISNTQDLKSNFGASSDDLELVYLAKVTVHISTNGYELPAGDYCEYIPLCVRPFHYDLLDNVADENVNKLLQGTENLRHAEWLYNDLCRVNVRIQDLILGEEYKYTGEHAESFFGGKFKSMYDDLVGEDGNVSIKATIPRGGFGNPMHGAASYQGDYYVKNSGSQEKILYYLEKHHDGIAYEEFMVVCPESGESVQEAAQKRLDNYLRGTNVKATVSENNSGRYLIDEGLIWTEGEEEPFYSELPESVVSWLNNHDINASFESANIVASGKIVDEDEEWVITGDAYKLYDVAFTIDGEEDPYPMTYAIVKATEDEVKEYDAKSYGSDVVQISGNAFGTVGITSNTGIIPFDLYMDASEVKIDEVVADAKWDGKYAAINIVPGSNITEYVDGTDASGKAIKGYSMKVTATGVELSGDALVSGDSFCVWDGANEEYLKDENGNVKMFLTGEGGTVEFEAKHFSTYAIVPACTHESVTHVSANAATSTTDGNLEYWICDVCGEHFKDATDRTQKYANDEWVIPATGGGTGGGGGSGGEETDEPNVTVDVDPSGNIVVNFGDNTTVTGGTASTTISTDTAADIAKSITDNKSTEVKLDATVKESVDKTELEIPMVIAEAADTNGASVEIATNVGSVVLDKQTVKGLAKTEADSITVSVEKTDASGDDKAVFDITLTAVKDGKATTISKLQGTAQVVAPLPSGLKAEEACGLYLNGKLAEKVTTKVDGKNVVLTVKHFSTYGIMSNDDADKLFKKSAEATTMGKLTLKAYKGGKIKASWKNGSGNTGDITKYQVCYKQSGKKAKYTTTTSKSKTIKKLKKGKKYTVKTRAYIKINGKTYKSKWSTAKKIKCK